MIMTNFQIESNKDLRHRLSEQTNEMASLMRQLADLKLALRQTQTALNNNIYHADRYGWVSMETEYKMIMLCKD